MRLRTLRATTSFLILPIYLAGCASTSGVSSKIRTVASVGDRPLPVVSGEPGASVVADRVAPERARNDSGRISGRVVDENGNPRPDVRVRLAVGNAPGGKVIQATTDRTGAFTLRGVRPGASYTVIAEWEDNQDHLTGRSVVRAPDTDVRISLGPSETDPPGALSAGESRRVNPVSEHEEPEPEPESFADDEPSARSRNKVNEEDLPPAPEAEALSPARTRRAASNLPRDATPRVARWRRGGSDRPAPAGAGPESEPEPESESQPDGRDRLPASDAPDLAPRRSPRSFTAPDAVEEDEDGPNPLPPALERGRDSGASSDETGRDPLPEVRESLAQAAEPPASLPDLPSPVEAPSSPGPDAATVDRTSLAIDDSLPPPVEAAPKPGPAPPPFEPAPAAQPVPPPTVIANAPAPAPSDQSIFETEPAESSPESAPAEGRKRPTWRELASIAAATPVATDRPTEQTVVASTRPPSSRPPAPAATSPAPRAAPRPPDDGRAYCEYDPKYRKIKDFRLPDLQGRPVRFQDIDADLILIDFWGTWCQPCLRSVPHLVELQNRVGTAKLKVVGIACEQGPPAERAQRVAQEVRRLGINYPVLLSGMDGPCPLQEALQIQAFPTLVLVDRQGRVVWRDQGATPVTLARLDRFLASAVRTEGVRRY